jgi:hypothetical protein
MVAVQRVTSALRLNTKPGESPRASWRDDFVAAILTAWMGLGLLVDGWAHINLRQGRLGPFFTPWHGILYAGFTAAAIWILTRGQDPGLPRSWSLSRVPRGYGLALVGMGVATIGVGGDAIWHTIFGEEKNVARLLGPFHLVLMFGAALVASSPLRSAWHNRKMSREPSSREFLPALISLLLTTLLASFFLQFLSPFVTWFTPQVEEAARNSTFSEGLTITVIAGILIWNLLLMGPLLVILRRWHPPFGTVTLLFTSIAAMMSALNEFARGGLILGALVGGLTIDILIARVRPSAENTSGYRVVAGVGPAVLWTAHFAMLRGFYGITFPPEIWVGTVIFAMLGGFALAVINTAPALPKRAVIAGDATVAGAAMAAQLTRDAGPMPQLVDFVQELADYVEQAETAALYSRAAQQAREASRMLRRAAEKLPGHLKPSFPVEAELAQLETLAQMAAPPSADYIDAVRDAAGILAGTRRGLPLEATLQRVLFNLTARAEDTLLSAHRSERPSDAGQRQREAIVAALADGARLSAFAGLTARHLNGRGALNGDGNHDHVSTQHVIDLDRGDIELDLTDQLREHT